MTAPEQAPSGVEVSDADLLAEVDEFDDEMTPLGVAMLTDYSLETLRRKRKNGTGPRFYRRGRHVVYRRTDVLAWMRERNALVPGRPE